MVPQNFEVLAKLGCCSKYSQNVSGCSFAGARIFLQVFACSVISGGSFLKMLATCKASFSQCSCSERPFDTLKLQNTTFKNIKKHKS